MSGSTARRRTQPTAALAAGNLIVAERAAFEVPFLPLADARALVERYAEKGDRKYERAAFEYLARYMTEANPSLTDVAQSGRAPRRAQPAHARALAAHGAEEAGARPCHYVAIWAATAGWQGSGEATIRLGR